LTVRDTCKGFCLPLFFSITLPEPTRSVRSSPPRCFLFKYFLWIAALYNLFAAKGAQHFTFFVFFRLSIVPVARLPSSMTAANGTHPVLASAHVASQPSYDFGSGRGPSESASARGGRSLYTCLATRPITHRTRMPEFLERQSAVDNRRLPPAPRTEQNTADLARVVIDAMAVAGCRGWNCDIAWQTARELLPSTPEAELAAIIERVQWELCAA
jgi:hypothetical protein